MQELIEFELRLDNSLQRDLVKMEHVRMRVANEGLLQDLVDMELIELKFIFDRSKLLFTLASSLVFREFKDESI